MRIMIIGASMGLGRAFVEGLCKEGDSIIGVSRNKPHDLRLQAPAEVQWIEADMADPRLGVDRIESQTPEELDAIIYNLGIWEERAFEDDYSFAGDSDERIVEMVDVNITATILLLKRLMPRLLRSPRPKVILTGSTSGLPHCGRPEVTFGASKFALKGIADALRENYRENRLGVTCLQLGYLNTEDSISSPVSTAAQRDQGYSVPVHDVVRLTRAVLNLSESSFVKEIIVPAILDDRF